MMTMIKRDFFLFQKSLPLKTMMELNQKNNYKFELKRVVEDYLLNHPNLSLNALANRADIPVSTLRRVVKTEKSVELAPHLTLNLMSYLYREKNLNKLLGVVPQEIAHFLKKHFGHFIFENNDYEMDLDLNNELKDPIKYFIYKLASHNNGVGLDEVIELYGHFGKEKINELGKNGFLDYREGRFFAKIMNFSLDLETMASHLPMLASKYRPEKLEEGKNLCYSLSESLNSQGILKIKEAQKEAINKMLAIMNDQDYQGDIPYFCLNLSEQAYYQDQGVKQ